LIEPIGYPQGALNARGVGTHPEKLRCLDGPLSRRLCGLHGRRHAQAHPADGGAVLWETA